MEIIILVVIIIVDQLSKIWVNHALHLGGSIPVIENVFHITNVHNTGAAWGMLAGGRALFLIFTPVFCGLLIWFLIKKRPRLTVFERICLTLLIGGAIGNFIDRVALSYVRDMFDFCVIRFPVFNVADSAITIGAIMLVIDTVFHKGNSIMDMFDNEAKNDTPVDASGQSVTVSDKNAAEKEETVQAERTEPFVSDDQ